MGRSLSECDVGEYPSIVGNQTQAIEHTVVGQTADQELSEFFW
jgi:hypothetical protein